MSSCHPLLLSPPPYSLPYPPPHLTNHGLHGPTSLAVARGLCCLVLYVRRSRGKFIFIYGRRPSPGPLLDGFCVRPSPP